MPVNHYALLRVPGPRLQEVDISHWPPAMAAEIGRAGVGIALSCPQSAQHAGAAPVEPTAVVPRRPGAENGGSGGGTADGSMPPAGAKAIAMADPPRRDAGQQPQTGRTLKKISLLPRPPDRTAHAPVTAARHSSRSQQQARAPPQAPAPPRASCCTVVVCPRAAPCQPQDSCASCRPSGHPRGCHGRRSGAAATHVPTRASSSSAATGEWAPACDGTGCWIFRCR
nr:unnamed protein product [Digitaria exilis]